MSTYLKEAIQIVKERNPLKEGAWQLPKGKGDFKRLAQLLDKKVTNSEFQDIVYHIIGDDDLFDVLDKLDPDGVGQAAKATVKWMKEQPKDGYSNYPDIWADFQRLTENEGPKYPDVEVQLTGEDGNAFAIMGAVGKALRRAGVSKEEIDQFNKEAMSGDYDNLLQTAMKWVDVN